MTSGAALSTVGLHLFTSYQISPAASPDLASGGKHTNHHAFQR